MKTIKVKVSAKVGDKKFEKEKSFNIRPENMADVQTLAKARSTDKNQYEKEPFNYVADAIQNYEEYAGGIRTNLRNEILAEVEGPSKLIDKTAKALFAAGLADTLEAARASVVAQRKAKNLPV